MSFDDGMTNEDLLAEYAERERDVGEHGEAWADGYVRVQYKKAVLKRMTTAVSELGERDVCVVCGNVLTPAQEPRCDSWEFDYMEGVRYKDPGSKEPT